MKLNPNYIQALKEVRDLCFPFITSLNLTMFAYSRVFNDGSRSELWTNLNSLDHSFVKKKYIAGFYTPNLYEDKEKYVYLPNKVNLLADKEIKQKYLNQLADQRNIFDNDNCFNIVKKSDRLCEYFIFYTSKNFKDPINFYLNNIIILEKFIDNFKNNAKELIQIADGNKIVHSKRNPIDLNHMMLNSIESSFINENQTKFTKRELQICRDIVKGKTAGESALSLGLSVRTVEKYIEYIKEKVDCSRKVDLAVKLIKFGIF